MLGGSYRGPLGLLALRAYWMVSYRISVCAHSFYHGYKNHGWVFASPTPSFIIMIVLLQRSHAHALALLLRAAFR
jgi:hypothetical protein